MIRAHFFYSINLKTIIARRKMISSFLSPAKIFHWFLDHVFFWRFLFCEGEMRWRMSDRDGVRGKKKSWEKESLSPRLIL